MAASRADVGHDGSEKKPGLAPLDRAVYGVVEAAGLLGLRTDRARARLDGYERRGLVTRR